MNNCFRFTATSVFAATVLSLLGCGSSVPPEPPPPPPVRDTAFGDLVGTMDRARGVQETTDRQKQALDQAIERSEGGQAPGDTSP